MDRKCENKTRLRHRDYRWGPVRGGLYVPSLNFKRFHVAISEGSHVAVGILSKVTDIDIDKFFCCDRACIHPFSRHMQMSIQRVCRYNGGVSGYCSWSLKCVKVFWTWGRLQVTLACATGALFSVVLWPVSQTDLLLEEESGISFECSLFRFLFFVLGPLCESWERFLVFSLNFPEGLRLYLVMSDIGCAGNTR